MNFCPCHRKLNKTGSRGSLSNELLAYDNFNTNSKFNIRKVVAFK
jgi:hypothetical protein